MQKKQAKKHSLVVNRCSPFSLHRLHSLKPQTPDNQRDAVTNKNNENKKTNIINAMNTYGTSTQIKSIKINMSDDSKQTRKRLNINKETVQNK